MRVGLTGPRPNQHRFQRRRSKHAPASEPEAHCCRDTAAGHAHPLDARGAEPAPRGAGAYRASGHPTGRKLDVPHPPTGKRAGRRGCARPRALGAHGWCSGASRQPGTHAGQGAAPRHARAIPRWRRPQRHQRPAGEQQRATTLDGVEATTAGTTAHRRWSPREPACSPGRSARRASPSASANPRRLTNSTGRRTPAYGSTTTAWRVSWVGPPLTRLSSVTCPCTSPLGANVARAHAGQPNPQLG
jgi:hypothetical protein